MENTDFFDGLEVMHVSPQWSDSTRLLVMETVLASGCLKHGLTSVRKGGHAATEYYYDAFINLAVGFERLFKIILHLNSLANNGNFVTKNKMRNLGHNLERLMCEIDKECNNPLEKSFLQTNILNLLSEFAIDGRYYNLDNLYNGGGAKLSSVENWFQEVERYALQAYQEKIEKIVVQNGSDRFITKYYSSVLLSHPSCSFLFSSCEYKDFYCVKKIFNFLNGEIVLEIVMLIKLYVEVLIGFQEAYREKVNEDFPYFQEFFALFLHFRKSDIKKRKTFL